MARDRSNTALQVIFSFFLGLMVVAFIGVGVYTFYPPPEQKVEKQLQELYRQQEDIQNFKDQTQLTAADREKLRTVQLSIRKLEDQQKAARETWGRNTSIILITFATIVMSISLIRAEQLRVISNGLLLGGVFTMLYGTGWVIATGTSKARFWVMTVALVITLALGYLKFVRNREQGPATATPSLATGEAADAGILADLAARVEQLEERNAAAAAALGPRDDARH
jgi:uncharacterized protein HemX